MAPLLVAMSSSCAQENETAGGGAGTSDAAGSGAVGGAAAGIADVLFRRYAPTGKLGHTWPRSMAQVPINLGDADYATEPPLYPFGHGLTY